MLAEPDISDLTGVKRKRSGSLARYKQVLSADPCSYCGCPRRLMTFGCNVDHIIAQAEGGPNHWSNYTAACEWCNALKSNFRLWVFLLLREYLEREADAA